MRRIYCDRCARMVASEADLYVLKLDTVSEPLRGMRHVGPPSRVREFCVGCAGAVRGRFGEILPQELTEVESA